MGKYIIIPMVPKEEKNVVRAILLTCFFRMGTTE
jgi:hypothetical protein